MALFSGIGDKAPQGPLESTIIQEIENEKTGVRKSQIISRLSKGKLTGKRFAKTLTRRRSKQIYSYRCVCIILGIM